MPVVALNDRLSELVDLDAEAEKIATGFGGTEGPVWNSRDQSLIFSDMSGGNIHRWTEMKGEVLLRSASGANGNTLDKNGFLITCEMRNRRVTRTLADGSVEVVVDEYKGRKLNNPNDVVCAPNGDIIFSDPSFTMRQVPPEYPYQGVFRYSVSTGSLKLLADDFVTPNGLAITDDGSTLYVVDSLPRHIRVFEVDDDGTLRKGRVAVQVAYGIVRATPDGMKLDSRGNIYVACNTEHGVWVYEPDGTLLGFIKVGANPTNLAFGGEDWRSLFVTAGDSVYRVPMRVAGQPVRIS